MKYFQNVTTMKKLLITIIIMLIVDGITDQLRLIFNLYPDNLILSGVLGVTIAIFAGLFTGVFFIEDSEEAKE